MQTVEFIRKLIDRLSSPSNQDGETTPQDDPNTPQVTKAPNLAMMVPVEFDQQDHSDPADPMFPTPDHGREVHNADSENNDLTVIKIRAGLMKAPEQEC